MKLCWNLTNLCNESCVYCFRELKEGALSIDDNIKILHKLKGLNTSSITFAGGEPLLYQKLPLLMEECYNLGIKVNLITNGSLLNENNLDDYLKYLTKLTFSIDSSNSRVNNTSGRGINHYEHIKSILPIIRKKYPHIVLEVNTVLIKGNTDEIDFMFETLENEISYYGLKKWKIIRFCPLRGYAKLNEKLFAVSDETFQLVNDKYDGKNSSFEIEVRDFDEIQENIILSPSGHLKKATGCNEFVITKDIAKLNSWQIKRLNKKLSGGHYV